MTSLWGGVLTRATSRILARKASVGARFLDIPALTTRPFTIAHRPDKSGAPSANPSQVPTGTTTPLSKGPNQLPESILRTISGGAGEKIPTADEKLKERERLQYLKAYGGSAHGVGATAQGDMPFMDPDSAGKFIPLTQPTESKDSSIPSDAASKTLEVNSESTSLTASSPDDASLAKLDPITAAAEKQQRIFWELMEKDEDPEVAFQKAVLASDPFEKLPPPTVLAAYLVVQNERLVDQRGVGKLGEQFQQQLLALSNQADAVETTKESARKAGIDDRKSIVKDTTKYFSQRLKELREKREDAQWGDAGKNFKENLLKKATAAETIVDVTPDAAEASTKRPSGASAQTSTTTHASSSSPSSTGSTQTAAEVAIKTTAAAQRAERLALQGALGPDAKKHAQAALVTRNLMGELQTKDPYADWVVKPIHPSRPETGIRTRAEFSKMIYQKKVEAELKAAKKYPSMAKFYPEWTMPTIHEMRVELLPKPTLELESRRRITTEELNTRHSGTFRNMMSKRMYMTFMMMVCLCILSFVGTILWDHHMEFTRGITPPSWYK